MESSRTSLASKTHFDVLGLGLVGQVLGLSLKASSPRNCLVLGSRTALLFELLKVCWAPEKILRKRFFLMITWKLFWRLFFFFFFWERLKKFSEDLSFWRALALVFLVLGLEHSCPWPRECLSSVGLFLAEEDTRLEANAKAKDTKKSEAKAKDSLSEDRHSRGQGQECSSPRPRTKDTSASALQKKKKSLHKKFSCDLHKKTFSKEFFKRSTKF